MNCSRFKIHWFGLTTACSAGRKRSWIIYCWLVWCERKILFLLEIYDRLRPSEQAEFANCAQGQCSVSNNSTQGGLENLSI